MAMDLRFVVVRKGGREWMGVVCVGTSAVYWIVWFVYFSIDGCGEIGIRVAIERAKK